MASDEIDAPPLSENIYLFVSFVRMYVSTLGLSVTNSNEFNNDL